MASEIGAVSVGDVRAVVKNLQGELQANPWLRERFGHDPRTVLQDFGLSRSLQRNLLQQDREAENGEGNSYCWTIWSILTIPDVSGDLGEEPAASPA